MDSVLDPEVESTVLDWASQTAGKTEVVNNIAGYFMTEEPSQILGIQPNEKLAEVWSKDRIAPMIRDTPVLTEAFGTRKSRDASDTIMHKNFAGGGWIAFAGANAPSTLAMRPARVNIFDEVDRYPASAGEEGDPIALAEKRADTFPNCVSIKTSTPTIRRKSRIEKEFNLSDKRYWFVPCPHCAKEHGGTLPKEHAGWQRLVWEQVKWIGDNKHNRVVWYECAECGKPWDDRMRIDAIWAGEWRPTAPFNGVRGYHLNGIYSLFAPKKGHKTRLNQFVEEFLKAKRLGKKNIQVWTNTFLSETWEDEQDVKPEWQAIAERREDYSITDAIPLGVIMAVAGLDFQMDRVEMEFVGYGRDEETWGLGHTVLWGDPRDPEMYRLIDQNLNKFFTRSDGARIALRAAGFDTGYVACQPILYAYLAPRLGRRFFAMKGASKKDADMVARSARSKVKRVSLVQVGGNRIKTVLMNRLTILKGDPGKANPGQMHFPREYTDDWFMQLVSEDSTTQIINGQEIKVFTLPDVTPEGGTKRNEALDCRVYAHGAYILATGGVPDWEAEDKYVRSTIIQAKPQQATQQKRRYELNARGPKLLSGLR